MDFSKYKPFVLSFEETKLVKEESSEIDLIIKKYDSKIKFLPVNIEAKGLFPHWLDTTWKRCKVLYSVIRKYNIKLLHARSFKPAFLSVIVKIFFNRSIRVIYDNRGLYIDELIFRNGLTRGSLKERLLRIIEKMIITKCDQIVVVSNAFKSHLAEQFGTSNINVIQKIRVIPNRIQLNLDSTNNVIEKKKVTNKTICVYSGSSADWQGIDDFYKVFSLILNQIPSTHFKISLV